MAELLIKKKPHRFDTLTQVQVDEMNALAKGQYDVRRCVGSLFDIQETGKWPDKAAAAKKFYYIRVTDAEKKDLRYLKEPAQRYYNTDEIDVLVSREQADLDKLDLLPSEKLTAVQDLRTEKSQEVIHKYNSRYYIDLSLFTVDEMKTLNDGKFLEITKKRLMEVIVDKGTDVN